MNVLISYNTGVDNLGQSYISMYLGVYCNETIIPPPSLHIPSSMPVRYSIHATLKNILYSPYSRQARLSPQPLTRNRKQNSSMNQTTHHPPKGPQKTRPQPAPPSDPTPPPQTHPNTPPPPPPHPPSSPTPQPHHPPYPPQPPSSPSTPS